MPDTKWVTPTSFPRLEDAPWISLDTETYDPNLFTHGPGWATGDGHIVGISVAVPGHKWYFPMRHEYGGGNMDANMVLKWAAKELGRSNQPKYGANLMYDIGWLKAEGVEVKGELHDVQFAEPLLNEHAFSYALDVLGEQYLGRGKTDDALYAWCQQAYGGPAGRKQAGNIYRAPVQLVGPYAEDDAALPYEIAQHQKQRLEAEGLWDLYRMECQLIPLLIEMRMRGVRVDVEQAEQTQRDFLQREAELQTFLDKESGIADFNPDTATQMVRAFDALGLPYGKTAKGNPSFAQSVLDKIDHPFVKAIAEKKKLAKARGTFIEGYILDKHHNGRIHCQFHPLRRDDCGTVSGRFSSTDPNLQNIPARDKEMNRLVRGLFLPEEGHHWFAPDYSQIEYRALAHFAMGPGAEDCRQAYRNDPTTDYHDLARDIITDVTGRELDRKPVKGINFGLVFGQGKAATLAILGPGGQEVYDAYHEGLPFVGHTAKVAQQRAANRGFIRTILGRRARFPFWEPAKWYSEEDKARISQEKGDPKWFVPTLDKAFAIEKWGNVKRATTHKALNTLTQGTGADIIKQAMVNIYKAGLPIPLVQVHDELGFSLIKDCAEAAEIEHEMRTAVKLDVPLLVDGDWGTNWGNVG